MEGFFSAFSGGILLSLCSHGVDYLMVQRVLGCDGLASARKAMIASGFAVSGYDVVAFFDKAQAPVGQSQPAPTPGKAAITATHRPISSGSGEISLPDGE